jgi:hypothetical protein
MRTIQEWMGNRDFKTTLIYADYQPAVEEAALVERAFKGLARTPPRVMSSQTQGPDARV